MQLNINLARIVDNSYNIFVGQKIISELPKHILSFGNFDNYVIITDHVVNKLFGKKIKDIMLCGGLKAQILEFLSGEHYKTQATVSELQNKMFELGCGRNTLVIAVGGGVVGDIAGFVSSTFKRGVPFVQIPTTLLSMVDSSIGGKTGFNTAYGKNTTGAFWQPQLVLIDVEFLKTLPRRHLLNGLVEAIKIFLTNDKDQFNWIDSNLDKIVNYDLLSLQELIVNSLRIKSKIVERDEKEKGERMILNFGHSIGHALEILSEYKFLHGEAVALGMVVEANIACRLGLSAASVVEIIEKIVNKLGLSLTMLKEFDVAEIMRLMRGDKKNNTNQKKLVLLENVGQVYIKDNNFAQVVDDGVIQEVLKQIMN